MHCDQNYKYIYSIPCVCTSTTVCMYTVKQIAELTARGDSFVASVWRVAQSGDNEKEGGK